MENKFLQNFISESEEGIKEINNKMMLLETNSDHSAIDDIYRVLHTIKGNSSFFGFVNIKLTAHLLEDILSALRAGRCAVNKQLVDVMWHGVRHIDKEMALVRGGSASKEVSQDTNEFLIKAKGYAEEAVMAGQPQKKVVEEERYFLDDKEVTKEVLSIKNFLGGNGAKGFDKVITSDGDFAATVRGLEVIFREKDKKNVGSILSKMASDYEMMVDDSGKISDFLAKLLNELFGQVLQELRKVDIKDVSGANEKATLQIQKTAPTFRIEEGKIDEVLASVRKIDEVKKAFSLVRNEIMKTTPSNVVFDFQKSLNMLNFLSRDILQMLLKIKVTSPNLLLEKVEQMITALASSCNKKVVIKTKGNNIFVDRAKIELLEKVLVHIVRNSIDHGIESAEERVASGKPETGSVSIEVYEAADNLVISVYDDGAGIDCNKLKEAAYDKGIITKEQLENMGDSEAAQLVFLPGITTKKDVTEISGRGMGMDAAFKAVKESGGSVEVITQKGKGTTIILKFPIKGSGR